MSGILRNYKTFSPNQWTLENFLLKGFLCKPFLFTNTYSFSYPLISWVKRRLKIKTKVNSNGYISLELQPRKTIKLMVTSPGTINHRTMVNPGKPHSGLGLMFSLAGRSSKQNKGAALHGQGEVLRPPPLRSGGEVTAETAGPACGPKQSWDVETFRATRTKTIGGYPPIKEVHRKAVNNKHVTFSLSPTRLS